jgi:tetratricopeptide (TPR) repeat protein
MPSHIFTRVGSWDESIATNLASVSASRREGSVSEELHASDYLVYAYLQSGRDVAAAAVVHALPGIEWRFHPDVISGAAPASAAYFAMAAIPARYALERGDWASASRLKVRVTKYPYTEAITWFARGMGSARLGEIRAARHAAQHLAVIHEHLVDAKEAYWALQVEIQWLNVVAWTALARKGDPNRALEQMYKAVAMEDGTEKSAVTPGPIAPAHELLAEMLLQLNRPAEALREFEATLAKEPNRFRALYGAARSAQLAGNVHGAQSYASALLNICRHADQPGRAELAQARAIANASAPKMR